MFELVNAEKAFYPVAILCSVLGARRLAQRLLCLAATPRASESESRRRPDS